MHYTFTLCQGEIYSVSMAEILPSPETPALSFNAPDHIQKSWVERISLLSPNYEDLDRNVLYSSVKSAIGNSDLIAKHPLLRLQRQIAQASNYPWVFRYWSTDVSKVNRSLGQDNLIPAKYRKLTTHVETISWENIEAAFPSSLTGDQAFIEKIQETILEARKRIVEEVINAGTSLVGHETDDQGTLTVTETIVDDGTSIDTGYLVKRSEVTPLGNGKSIKISVTYASFPVMYDYDIDPETGQTILSSYQIVDKTTAATATSSSGVITRYKHIDNWRSLKIITTHSTPASYDEQRFGAYSFPTLFSGSSFASDDCGVFVGLRAGFSAMVKMRTTIIFTTTKQTITGLTILPGSLYLGKWFNIRDALFNAGTYAYSGTCTASGSFGATSPTYTAYIALIDTEQLMTGESVRTNTGLYKNTSVYVTMK